MKKRIVLLGPPGAGKGTQAIDLVDELGFSHISTGDILRKAVKEGTQVGRKAEVYMNKGELVPDEVMAGVVLERLAQEKSGFILDGFPRTAKQAEILENGMNENGIELAIEVTAPTELIVGRLTNRRSCRKCGAVYHLINIPPREDGICDKCGGELFQRDDDCEETIHRRLEVYREQVKDLIQFYKDRGVLVEVDGSAERQATLQNMLDLIRS